MEVVVNDGKGANFWVGNQFDVIQKMISKVSDMPECFKDFVVTYDDGFNDGQYIFKMCVGNMELEGSSCVEAGVCDCELSYYNADTNGVTTRLKIKDKLDNFLDIAVGIGIFGKAFESMGKSIMLENLNLYYKDSWGNQEELYFTDENGKRYMLARRFYQFAYELNNGESIKKYNGKHIYKLLNDNGKQIYSLIKKHAKKQKLKLGA